MHQRTIDKKKIWRTFFSISFYFPKKDKTVFDLYLQAKNKYLIEFFEFLAFKTIKENVPPVAGMS